MIRDLSWKSLLSIEPKLKELLQTAKDLKAVRNSRSHFCANSYWIYNPIGLSYSQVLKKWFENDPEVYKVAADKIYSNLPDCKNCYCKIVGITPKNRRLNQIEKLFKQLKKAAVWCNNHPEKLEDFNELHLEAQPIFDKLETLGVSNISSESVFVFGPEITPRLVLQFEEGFNGNG